MAVLKIQSRVTMYNLSLTEEERNILITTLKAYLANGIHHDTKMLLMAIEGDIN